ncbi:unnamed protein product [Schistosoma spindalis]|nr:unnamed protein product [Schistosoma spindale]
MSSDYSDMPLPPNWEARIDSESGHWYYINHEDKTTSWDDPRPAYYSAQQLDLLNTYRMGFGDRQDLIGEFFDISEISSKSHKNPKSVNPKPCDDRSKDVPTTKTHRSRIESNGEISSRKNSHSKGRTSSTYRNRESKSSVCSQNDNESYHSSIYVSPVGITGLSLEKHLDTVVPTTTSTSNTVILTEDNSLQKVNTTTTTTTAITTTTTTPTTSTVILTENDPFQKMNTAEILVEKQSLVSVM